MKVEIKGNIIDEIGDLPEQLGLTQHDFLVMAIRNQINISKTVLEDDIPMTDEFHTYPVLGHEVGRLMRTLEYKGIEAELLTNPEDRKDKRIKARISSRDFGYLKVISKHHSLYIPDPPIDEMRTGKKMKQLDMMYHN